MDGGNLPDQSLQRLILRCRQLSEDGKADSPFNGILSSVDGFNEAMWNPIFNDKKDKLMSNKRDGKRKTQLAVEVGPAFKAKGPEKGQLRNSRPGANLPF